MVPNRNPYTPYSVIPRTRATTTVCTTAMTRSIAESTVNQTALRPNSDRDAKRSWSRNLPIMVEFRSEQSVDALRVRSSIGTPRLPHSGTAD